MAKSTPASSDPAGPTRRIITILGTNDLHGHISETPLLGGYVANARAARARDGGGVLLVDAGDMFQGTIESNLGEGRAVLHAYAALDYQAAAIGNHEFDYGPVGSKSTPSEPGDDPRGALGALANTASFAMLNANLADKVTHRRFTSPRIPSSTLVEVAGVTVGIVGVTSSDTLETTIAANVKDLEVVPLAEAIATEAARLRKEGHADVVVALTHAGGKCKTFTGDLARDGCELDSEVFRVARALPKGSVDAIVAGHTHQGLAQSVEGIPIIESFSYGKAFGRIDLTVEPRNDDANHRYRIAATKIFPPRELCAPAAPDAAGGLVKCVAGEYEGAPVVPDARVAAAIQPDIEKAKSRRQELLGVHLEERVRRDYEKESAEGNLFADLLHKAHPEATVVMMNGGGLRADLPAGDLSYGALFEAFPFDNKVATVKLGVSDLEKILSAHFARSGGIVSVSGIRVLVKCDGGRPKAKIERVDGKKLGPKDTVSLLSSDFMLTGGDSFWGPVARPEITINEELMRDTIERQLRAMKKLKESDVIDPKKPRLVYPGARPVDCGLPQ